MDPELNPRTWYSIARDVSLDAVQPYLPEMGLWRSEDPTFTLGLRPLLEKYNREPIEEHRPEEFAAAMLHAAQRYGQDYARRFWDWGSYIYPNLQPRQHQVFLWRNIVIRGATKLTRDVQPPPKIVQSVRAILANYKPVLATELHPLSDWDIRYCAEREDEVISPFEWLEVAVRFNRFLHAWGEATKGGPMPDELARVYQWAMREAELLRMRKEELARPEECLTLPETLRLPSGSRS